MALEDQLTDDLTDEALGPTRTRRRPGALGRLQADPDGNEPPVDDKPTQTPAPVTPPTNYRIQPVDPTKFADPTHSTAKYQFLRTAQGFDPTKGITPEFLAKLNALGLANFTGSGQKLGYTGITDAGRAAGMTSDFEGDFIQNWGNGANPDAQWAWNWADEGGQQTPAAPLPARTPMTAPGPMTNTAGAGGSTPVPRTGGIDPMPGADTSNYTPEQARAAGLGWVPPDHPLYGTPGFVGSAAGGGAGTGATPSPTSLEGMIAKLLADNEAAAEQRRGFSDNIHRTVTDQIAEGSTPVNEEDASITQPMRAYAGEQGRALNEGREAMAARAQHQGMPTGANDAALQSSYENLGTDKANYKASLIVDQLKQKQAKLQNALNVGAGMLSAEEARSLNQQLAMLDARIKQMDLKQSGDIANRDIDVRQNIAGGQLALGNRQEDDRMNMFYDQLGLDIGSRESALNQWLMNLLAGG